MPNKKNNTTLVTQDELMETVTARVTENIREEIDQRFTRFEQALHRITASNQTESRPSSPLKRKRLEETDIQVQPPSDKAPSRQDEITAGNNSHSSFHDFGQAAATQPGQTLPSRDVRDVAGLHPVNPEVRRAHVTEVNNNNNNAAWNAWRNIQQPFSAAYAYSGSPGDHHEHFDPSLETQVRHIMEATPHHLKGNAPIGYFPYKYVTRGPEKRRLNFNTVTLAEHIYGIFRMLDDVNTDATIKPHLLAHMREVSEDACEFEWGTHVRRWSEEVFTQVVEKRLPAGWDSTARIQNLRTGMSRVDTARISLGKEPAQRRFTTQQHNSDALRGGPPCVQYNTAQGCSLQSGHLLNGVKQVHVCSYCLSNTAAAHPHPEARCRTKQRHAATHF